MGLIQGIKNILSPRFDVYECEECGHSFKVKPDQQEDGVSCPECGSDRVIDLDLF